MWRTWRGCFFALTPAASPANVHPSTTRGISLPVPMLAPIAKLDKNCTKALIGDLQKKGLALAVRLPSIGNVKNYRYHLSENGKNIVENNKDSHEK